MKLLCSVEDIGGRPGGENALDQNFLVSPRDDVKFIFVEKVGCTTLKSLLVSRIIGDISGIEPRLFGESYERHNIVHLLAWTLRANGRRALRDPATKIVTFCRNPYDRFVSAFYNRIQHPPLAEREQSAFFRREILQSKAWEAISSGALWTSSEITLSDFIRYVASTVHNHWDRHWAPQHLINLRDVLEPDILIRLESFSHDLAKAWEELFQESIIGSIEHNNKSERPQKVLNSDMAAQIYDIYKLDFDLFNYDPDSWIKY